jgi:L-alanine-DL-glutamate epimerase-like enolase superfamily enzyme
VKVTGFELYALPFAFGSGGYTTSYGTRTHLNNLLLVLFTDSGQVGLGEVCRKAGNTIEPTTPAFIQRARGFLQQSIGSDPLDPGNARARLGEMQSTYSNLSCAFETACFDLAAKSAGRPLWTLLGGKQQESVPVYHTIGQSSPERMAAEAQAAQQQGCRVLQVKVGATGDIEADKSCVSSLLASLDEDTQMLVDANGGWDADTALSAVASFVDDRIFWEEPCRTYAENKYVADNSTAAVILDQCVTGPEVALQACRDGAVHGMGIKCTMQGGLLAGRLSRDLAIEHGMKLKVDDSWSADVATAASLHLALAVPPEQLIASVDMRSYLDGRISSEGPVCEAYRFAPNSLPGLGLVAELDALGPPLASYAAYSSSA